jgi:hypothetical protein
MLRRTDQSSGAGAENLTLFIRFYVTLILDDSFILRLKRGSQLTNASSEEQLVFFQTMPFTAF